MSEPSEPIVIGPDMKPVVAGPCQYCGGPQVCVDAENGKPLCLECLRAAEAKQ